MPKLSPEFKAALVRMPAKEKDKLLLRLVAKDAALIDKLTFQLLEGGEDPGERRELLRQQIGKALGEAGGNYYTPGYLLLDLRHWNARITEHVKATTDKLADVELRLWMLNEAVRQHEPMLNKFNPRRARTLAPYLVQRTAYIFKKIESLHEDYYLEIREPLQRWLQFLYRYRPTAEAAREAGIPRQWE